MCVLDKVETLYSLKRISSYHDNTVQVYERFANYLL